MTDTDALRALLAPLTDDAVQDLPLALLQQANPDSQQGWVPVIVDSHYDHIVNHMPTGTAYFEPEMAALIVAAVNALPALLTELDAARADDDNWHAAYDRVTGLLRKRFPPRPDGSLPDWRVEDICAELDAARKRIAELEWEIARHDPPGRNMTNGEVFNLIQGYEKRIAELEHHRKIAAIARGLDHCGMEAMWVDMKAKDQRIAELEAAISSALETREFADEPGVDRDGWTDLAFVPLRAALRGESEAQHG